MRKYKLTVITTQMSICCTCHGESKHVPSVTGDNVDALILYVAAADFSKGVGYQP